MEFHVDLGECTVYVGCVGGIKGFRDYLGLGSAGFGHRV